MHPLHSSTFGRPSVRIATALVLLTGLAALVPPGLARAEASAGPIVTSVSYASVDVALERVLMPQGASGAETEVRWRWHFDPQAEREPSAWESSPWSGEPVVRFARPAGAALLELVIEAESEEGPIRRVHPLELQEQMVLERPNLRGASIARFRALEDSVVVQGRVLFGDRLFDAEGYTGQRQWLLARAMELQWRSAADDALVATTVTDSAGGFVFRLPVQPVAGSLVLLTRGTDPVAGPYGVVDAAGAAHSVVLGQVDPQPGEFLDLGGVEVGDASSSSLAGAVHLFDLVTDALALLRGPDGPPGWGTSGQAVPVLWDPVAPNASTFFDGAFVIVASPASGSSDAWSDGAVLATVGHALLAPLGWPVPANWDWLDVDRSPRPSLARALGWTFAGAVQTWRARNRTDADGTPLSTPSELLVDLPSPPPLGFRVGLEAGLDLENGLVLPGATSAVARGQRGAPILAALLWETLDDPATYDVGGGIDDDPIGADIGRWLAAMSATLASVPAPVYEDLHGELVASLDVDEAEAFTGLAVDQAGCALEIDAFEPDDTVAEATDVEVWIQPALTSTGVRINEVFLGDRDGVELVNRGATVVDVGGWTIDARRNGFSVVPSLTVTLPSPTLVLPGRQLLVLEGTPLSARSVVDAPAPDWNVPWAPDEDGAVILRDGSGVAIDFVRWDGSGGADRSLEPIPAGTGFTGRLVAPVDGRQSLARDAVSTDSNAAANFAIAVPTPGWPNAGPPRVHTSSPRGDVDHLRLVGLGPVELHARRDRDDGTPRWTLADGAPDGVARLENGLGAQARGALATLWPTSTDTATVLRLDPAVPVATSTGLQVFAWRPASDFGVWPVRELRADPLGLGVLADSVRVSWTLRGRTDSLRVRLDGVAVRHLAGTDTSVVIVVPEGTHIVAVEPFLSDRVGAAREAGVYVGPVSCSLATGFEPGDPEVFTSSGGFLVSEGPAFSGEFALRDTPLGQAYPVDSEVACTLILPIELTTVARLRFSHAAHLVPDGDRAMLEISSGIGLTWTELARWDGASHPASAEDPADWGDDVLTQADWVQESFDLGDYAGERVRLRFRRTSNSTGTSIGWAIDDVVLDLGGTEGEYWVGVDGSDVTGCGIAGRPWASLSTALEVVQPGERIVLGPGRHDRAALDPGAPVPVFAPLPAGVELRGVGPDATVLVVPASGWGIRTVGAGADSSVATVRGLRIEGGAIGLRMEDVRVDLDSVEVVLADTAAVLVRAPMIARKSIFAHASVGIRTSGNWLDLQRSTLADVGIGVWLSAEGDSLRSFASLLGRADSTLVFTDTPRAIASIECSGIFGTLSPFEGSLSVFTLANRNFDPQHCDPSASRYTLAASSPYLAQPWCGLVGARGQGCSAPGQTNAPAPPGELLLHPPAPNPFNPIVTFAWEQPRTARARVEIFDLRGRRIRVLVDEDVAAGRREVRWSGEDQRGAGVASGVYLVRLQVEGQTAVQRVALIR
jgi:hypothetical protein